MSSPACPSPLDLVHLCSGTLRLEVAPSVGGSIARFCSERGDGRMTDWLRPAGDAGLASRNPLDFGSFPLIPFCNRIRDGRSTYGDLPLQMPPNMPPQRHVIHGTAWHQPWKVESRSADSLALTQQHRPRDPHDWPYPFDARLRYRLSPQALQIEIGVTNRGEHRMPTGIGHHPYFPHRPGTRLSTRVSAMWASDAQLLPTALTEPPFLKEMAQGIELSRIVLDNNFVGWAREARVDWPDEGTALVMRAEPPLDFFVLYSPAAQDHFCMEPVSNCTDWMNLAQQGIGPVGGTMLAPGETLLGRFELQPIERV